MKPFSKTEMKILVFNKVRKGIPYEQAVKEVSEELSTMNELKKFGKARKKAEHGQKDVC